MLISQSTLLTSLFFVFSFLGLQAQDNLIITVVHKNEPVIGAYILFGDTGTGTTTDYDGTASIPPMGRDILLQISYTGLETLEIPYKDLFNTIKYPGFVVTMKEAENIIGSVVVRAPSKFNEKEASVPAVLQRITQQEIQEKGSSTSAEVLEDANIFIQRSQAGGGSPIIRGFEANKVLIVLDGVRMNNAIYRNGHLQNVITVDNAMLSHIEVLYGPSAVVYGSDALGGVVYMESKAPLLSKWSAQKTAKDTSNANAYIRFANANQAFTTHLDFGAGGRKFGSITSLTFSRFGDVRSGTKAPSWRGDSIPENWMRNQYVGIVENDDIIFNTNNISINPYLQRGTNYGQGSRVGYWQLDALQKLQYRPSLNQTHTLNLQYSTSNNVQRYDQLSKLKNKKPKFAEWYYGPQKRALVSFTSRILKEDGKLFNKALFVAAYQSIGEDRYKRKLNKIKLSRNFEDLNVYSLNLDFMKHLNESESQVLFYGAEVTHNDVKSTADYFNVVTRETLAGYPTRYGNAGNSMSTLAFYANYRADIRQAETEETLFRFLGGLRYTYATTIANYEPSSYAPEIPYTKAVVKNGSLTGAVGLSYTPRDWAFKTSFATGYRVPNVDDLAKLREKNGFVTIPNPDLKPEYAYNFEVNIGKRFVLGERSASGKIPSSLTFSANYYYTILTNAIVRTPHHLPNRDTTINGVTQTIQGDTMFTIDGSPARVVINSNAAKANIQGYSLNMKFKFKDRWFLNASYNDIQGNYTGGQVDGNEVTSKIPLSHIPPAYGNVGIAYEFKSPKRKWRRFKTEVVYRFSTAKLLKEYDPSSGNSDNLDDAIEDYGTPKWATWNWYNTWRINKQFALNFNIENITDLHYRVFSSGISSPGRNFIITLKGTF